MTSRIYIIEDDVPLRTELAHLLELSGFEPLVCESFADAAAQAVKAQPDCVVLDLKLPGTDGHTICRDIRSRSDVPIIMLTSSDSEFDEIMGMNLGADDYVTKPYSPGVLTTSSRSSGRASPSTWAPAACRMTAKTSSSRATNSRSSTSSCATRAS